MVLRITLAGQVGIVRDDIPVDTGVLGGRGRVALAFLVLERRRPVGRDELAEVLWGENLPRTWETSLRGVVFKLRSLLAAAGLDRSEAVTSAFGTYQVHLPPDAVVDVEEAEAHLESARAALAADDAENAVGNAVGNAVADAVADAVALAAAAAAGAELEFLPGAAGRWVEQRQDALRELRLRALETLAEALLRRRSPREALAAAEGVATLAPLRESAHVLVMRAHALSGNRAEALRAYERMRRLLVEELGVSPCAPAEAVYVDLLQDEEAGPGATPLTLPTPLSSFVGRTAEVAQVADLVRSGRLVTLVGAGGLGKTRLALEVGRAVAPEFEDGAALVALGDVVDGSSVASQALAAVRLGEAPGRPALDTLTGALARRHLVLLVDNCEHLLAPAAELVDAVLRECPRIIVLATSRAPLRIPGELVWRVPSLATEDAAQLFRERAMGTEAEAADVDALCRRLDGLPLAIELAAARADVLSVPEIVDRLDDRFRLLTGGARTAPARHQTLRGAMDWTYDALPEPERRRLQAIAVFSGDFTLDAAAQVAFEDGEDVLDGMGALVARSLVLVGPGGRSRPTRYRMLETIRAYALEKLDASGSGPAARARLLQWAAQLAETAEVHLDGPEQAAWLDRLDADHANLVGALASDPGRAGALRLATALGRFWEMRGHFSEGRQWLRAALADSDNGPPLLRARAHNAAALLAQRQGDYAAARSRLEASLAIRRREGDRLGAAAALHGLGNLAALQGDLPAARRLYEQALAVGRELGDEAIVAAALDNLGWVAHVDADFTGAGRAYEEALALRREAGDEHGTALVLGHLGDLAYQQGDYGRAASLHEESLGLRARLGDRAGRADALATLGHLAMHDGDLDVARARLEESLAIRRELGHRAALPSALISLGDLALLSGAADVARALVTEAVDVASANRDHAALAHVLIHSGRVARVEGHYDEAARRYAEARRAAGRLAADAVGAEWLEGVAATLAAGGDVVLGARLLGAADALRETIGAPVPPHERPAHEGDIAAVRGALGPAEFAAAWEAGRAMPFAQATDEAAAAVGAA